jgi:hypothetical protein
MASRKNRRAGPKPKRATRLQSLQKRLGPFLRNNPASKIGQYAFGDAVAVKSPWGDTSIELVFPDSDDALVEALNNLLLPERFTAIWHLDQENFEIIYSVYPTSEADRTFAFKHRDRTYECAFADSSERLLLLAEHFYPVGPTTTDFRNLGGFSDYVLAKKGVKGMAKIPDARPLSFWIKGLKWDADAVLDLANHINFYMAYYDTESAQILIHSPASETTAMQPQTRFRDGNFPTTIKARSIEENLLHFWRASNESSDPIRNYINNYLILEYAAFFYIDDSVKRNVQKCLAAPNATANFETLTRRVLEAIGEKLPEVQRVQHLLKNCVEPRLIWREIEKNLDYFSKPHKFDGGYTSEPLVAKGATEEAFSTNWDITFEAKIRSIRNALSHGKEVRTLSTISPTTRNFELLEPWVPLVAVAAREVMVYRIIA